MYKIISGEKSIAHCYSKDEMQLHGNNIRKPVCF